MENKELSVRDLILIIKDFLRELAKKWYVVIICIAIALSYFLYTHFIHKVTYPMEIDFIVEQGNSSSMGVGGLLGQFGLNSNNSNPFKIQEVCQSGYILERTISSVVDDELIGNDIISVYQLDEKWSENNKEFENFNFSNDSLFLDNQTSMIAFKKISQLVWNGTGNDGQKLADITFNLENGIFTLKIETIDEELSIDFANVIFGHLKNFFENDIIENKVKAIEILNDKIDSLESERINISSRIANYNSLGRVFDESVLSKKNMLQQDLGSIMTALAEVKRNKELADFNLKNNKPLFLEIDKSLFPLNPIRSQLSFNLIKGLFLGLLLSIVFVFLSFSYKRIMND